MTAEETEMTETASYNDLADQYRDALDVERRAFDRMKRCPVGSAEGQRWSAISTAAARRADELRRAVHNHADAPPQG
jgi:hypothetical protein